MYKSQCRYKCPHKAQTTVRVSPKFSVGVRQTYMVKDVALNDIWHRPVRAVWVSIVVIAYRI